MVESDPRPRSPCPSRLSLAEVYETERDYLWRSLRRLGVPDRHLEDVAHDVFVLLHRLLPTHDPRRPMRPWLFAVAFRVASDFRRKAQNAREFPDDEIEVVDPSPSAEDVLSARESQALLRTALASLDPDRRAVFILHDIDGEKVPAIADALGVLPNTAYSRLRLARQEIARAVRRLRATETRGRR